MDFKSLKLQQSVNENCPYKAGITPVTSNNKQYDFIYHCEVSSII